MRALAWGCLTRHHAHHYLGFARTQRRLFDRTGELKPLLYAFRVLLTGTHLMRTGELVADLTLLLDGGPPYLPGLIEAKRRPSTAGCRTARPAGNGSRPTSTRSPPAWRTPGTPPRCRTSRRPTTPCTTSSYGPVSPDRPSGDRTGETGRGHAKNAGCRTGRGGHRG